MHRPNTVRCVLKEMLLCNNNAIIHVINVYQYNDTMLAIMKLSRKIINIKITFCVWRFINVIPPDIIYYLWFPESLFVMEQKIKKSIIRTLSTSCCPKLIEKALDGFKYVIHEMQNIWCWRNWNLSQCWWVN